MSANTPSPAEAETIARSKIGRHVTYFALTLTALLGVTAIFVAFNVAEGEKRFAYVKDVLTIILPLIGTWVGTVLAFYFSRENFVAAASQTADLVRQLTPEQKLQSISVTEAMIDLSAPTSTKLVLARFEDAAGLNLKVDVIDHVLEKFQRNRLPIVDGEGRVLFVVHRSFIDKFLVKVAADGSKALTDVTLRDLLEDPGLRAIFESFATVGRDAKLNAVKIAMDGHPHCSDVFVTADGTRGSKAHGWITNVIVRERSVA